MKKRVLEMELKNTEERIFEAMERENMYKRIIRKNMQKRIKLLDEIKEVKK
jgi:hypothetical protein|tara:strand:+ start:289 stop:441 length:153 start_codon:yes stop_codon:yes gene_type:complete